MTETYTRSIAEMQQLTHEYASFSQSRSGLGNVLGGAAGLIAFAAIWLLGHGLLAAALVIGATALWLVGKEIIRSRLYRPFGNACETWPPNQRRGHVATVALIAAVLAAFMGVILARTLSGVTPWSIGLPYLIFCVVTPWVAWRYLRTINEFMVGFYLLFASAIVGAGFSPSLLLFGAIVPLYSLMLIALGLKEHRQFQQLAGRLRARQEAQL